jgi:broad specificity phosphatase PhoE
VGDEAGTDSQGAARIFLVRHGQTEWSASGKHTSRTDLELLEEGRERAIRLGQQLAGIQFQLVLSSPFRRAVETCELAGYGEQMELCEDLHEWDYGDYEGITTPDIRRERPGWNLWRDGCPGGEQPEEVGARADRVLARLRSAGGNALAFAHGHILRVITARWLELDVAGGARFAMSAGSVGVLGYERETEVLQRWGA